MMGIETSRTEWAEAGVSKVAPDTYRVPLPLPNDALSAVNVYVLREADGVTLVDAGWAIQEAQLHLESALAELNHDLSDVKRFLVTHIHRDHYTLAVSIRRLFGSEIALGEGERGSLELAKRDDWRPIQAVLPTLQRAGAAPLIERLLDQLDRESLADEDWEEPDSWLRDFARIPVGDRVLQAIATPGHTRGHLVFMDQSRGVMFTGDHLLPHITPSVGYEPNRSELPLRDYLESLKLMCDLPNLRLLPAHGPVSESTHVRARALLMHHDQRLDATAAACGAAATAYDVAARLRWTRHSQWLVDLDTFNQMLAVMETVAHLDVLVETGKLVADEGEEVTVYSFVGIP
jgi:glyoxylase-like metal-dependent hydrolase (beta-lactamase superfamily II)